MYAQIVNGKANIIMVSPEDVESFRAKGLTIIDISAPPPPPPPPWSYDEETESFINPVVAKNYLYIHLTMSDGDGREPLGIINNGIDALSIIATFRESEDPSSSVITSITGLSWRISIRDSSNFIYDIIDVPFTNGVASVSYTTTDKSAICSVLESDFEKITVGETIYTLKLVGDSTFKVYRQL